MRTHAVVQSLVPPTSTAACTCSRQRAAVRNTTTTTTTSELDEEYVAFVRIFVLVLRPIFFNGLIMLR